MVRRNQVASEDGSDDSRDLAREIDDSAHFAHVWPARDERGQRPGHGRSRGKSAQRDSDPDKGLRRAVRVGRAQNAQAECRASDEDSAADGTLAEAALDEVVDEKSADSEIGRSGSEPWHAGVKERMQQIDMQRRREIRRQPIEQQKEDVVIRAKAKCKTEDLAPKKTLPERRGDLLCNSA